MLWVRIVNNGPSRVPAQSPPAAKMINYLCLKMTTDETADKDGWMAVCWLLYIILLQGKLVKYLKFSIKYNSQIKYYT